MSYLACATHRIEAQGCSEEESEGTYMLHQQSELFKVFLLLQVLQSEGEVTAGFINQCFQSHQVVTETQQAGNTALHSKAYE